MNIFEEAQIGLLEKRKPVSLEHPKAPLSIKWAMDVYIMHPSLGDRIESLISPAAFILDGVPDWFKPISDMFRSLSIMNHAETAEALFRAIEVCEVYEQQLARRMAAHYPGS